jgi:hypothetical protein
MYAGHNISGKTAHLLLIIWKVAMIAEKNKLTTKRLFHFILQLTLEIICAPINIYSDKCEFF